MKDNAASVLQGQIDAYSRFLEGVAELARSAWTKFNLLLMGFGLCIMLTTLCVHLFAIKRVNTYYPFPDNFVVSFRTLTVIFFVAIRAISFLSNSYICKLVLFNICYHQLLKYTFPVIFFMNTTFVYQWQKVV